MRGCLRLGALLGLVGVWQGRPAWAQANADGAASVRRADSLFVAGDRPAAREAYRALLAAQPDNSHATYRLAQLSDQPAAALRLYEKYVRLEPTDPWGYMAAGAAASQLGRYGDALRWYDRAAARAGGVRDAARDVAMGRARVHERAGRTERAIATYAAWLAPHPTDAEAWRDLGRQELKAGRPRAAARALERSLALAPNGHARTWLNRARALQAPAVEPSVGGSRDTDGNVISTMGVRSDVLVADGARLGVAAQHSRVADGLDLGAADALTVVGNWRPRVGVRLDWGVGLGRSSSSASARTGGWTAYPLGNLRLRVRAPGGGPRLDLRARHEVLALSPTLMANRVMRSEVAGRVSVPVGPIALRGLGQLAALTAGTQRNWRSLVGGGIAVPLTAAVEISGDVQRLAYADPSTVGYFAPRLAEVIEAGSYMDFTPVSRWDVELDVGAGMQREADHGAPLGSWRRALRLYGYSTFELMPGSALTLEIESYDAPLATAAATTSASWRWGSARLALRWALR